MDERKPAFWAVIPASVLFSEDLRPNAKLLYGVVTLLQESSGYCYASNRYLANLFGLQPETITGLLNNLVEAKLIATDVVRNPLTNEVLQRRIWTVAQMPAIIPPSPKNIGEGSSKKIGEPSPKNFGDPPRKKSEENNTSNNNTRNNIPPIVPRDPGDGCVGECTPEPEETPTEKPRGGLPKWKPERFSAFWKFYPRGENKQRAVRAWDKLKPDDALIAVMGRALARQKASPDWQRGIGIPHASTWLNGRRWEDEQRKPNQQQQQERGWADDWEALD